MQWELAFSLQGVSFDGKVESVIGLREASGTVPAHLGQGYEWCCVVGKYAWAVFVSDGMFQGDGLTVVEEHSTPWCVTESAIYGVLLAMLAYWNWCFRPSHTGAHTRVLSPAKDAPLAPYDFLKSALVAKILGAS